MVTSASGLAVLLPASPASASGTTFTSTGAEQTYTVPPGVNSVTITAVGAPGGAGSLFPETGNVGSTPGEGGKGASVTATVPVISGETLYVEVGGAGAATPCTGGSYDQTSFNGGGAGLCGGGGGGASDVRTCSMSTCSLSSSDTRLVVAGGGGGGGSAFQDSTGGQGGQGGDSTVTGAGSGGNGCDGLGCSVGAGGNGGFGPPVGSGGSGTTEFPPNGNPGTLGQGGSSNSTDSGDQGAGGGGGYDGGGAGGDANNGGGGGGAGSSSWISSATGTSLSKDSTGVPEAIITPGTPGYANVTVAKTASTQTPQVGTQDTFTLKASDAATSTSDTGQVVVTDVLAPGLTFDSSTAPAGTTVVVSGQTVTWTVPNIPIGGSVSLPIVVTVETGAVVTNVATFTQNAPNSAAGTTGSSNSLAITPSYANVTLSKSTTTTKPLFGGQDAFTLTASNSGASTAASGHVVVTDPLPSGLAVDSVTAPAGTTVVVSGQTVTWTIPSIAANALTTLQIVVTVETATATNTATFVQAVPNSSGGTSGSSNSVTLSPCAAGTRAYLLTATYRTGTFYGLFCVNANGDGTYTQYSPGLAVSQQSLTGPGHIRMNQGVTSIQAYMPRFKNLNLVGTTNGTASSFGESGSGFPFLNGTFTLT